LGGLQALLDALKRDLRPATRVSGGRADDARALAQDLGVDQVVVVSLTSQAGGVRAVATRVAYDGKELSFLDEAVADDGARLADFVSRVAGRELKGGGQGGLRWTSRYTGFTLVGLGVGIAGMGGAFGMAAKNSSDGFKTLHDQPQTNAIWDQRASEGRRYALVADISYIAALALVGTGLYFAITGKNADEESEPQPEIRIEEKKKEPEPARPADKKKPDDAKKPDDKRKAEDDRKAAEDRKRAEDEKKAAEDRKKADEDRKAEEKRKTEDETKISEEKRKAEAEEKKAKKAEDKRKAEDDKKAAEDARFAEEKKKFEEEQKAEQEADKKKADEARRKADEEKRKAEEEKKKAEEKKKKDEKKIQDFDDLRDDK
jgi:hypothetical protein